MTQNPASKETMSLLLLGVVFVVGMFLSFSYLPCYFHQVLSPVCWTSNVVMKSIGLALMMPFTFSLIYLNHFKKEARQGE